MPTTPPDAVVTPVTTSPSAVVCPSVEIPVTLSCSKLPPEPPPRTYSLTRDIAALRLVPPAPSSTTIRSASTRSAPISSAPSISKVVRGVVPADNPEPEPLNEEAVTIPEALTWEPVSAPATLREPRVPTDVSEELTTLDPRVVALRISVLLTL